MYGDQPMKIAVGGATGMIGSALVPELARRGHEVVRLVRREARAPNDVVWDPDNGVLDPAALDGVAALVNLAGQSVDARWTARRKQEIVNSRVLSTRLLAERAAALDPRPVLVCSSAVGIYGREGSRGDEELTEESSTGTGFLAELVAGLGGRRRPGPRGGRAGGSSPHRTGALTAGRAAQAHAAAVQAGRGRSIGRRPPVVELDRDRRRGRRLCACGRERPRAASPTSPRRTRSGTPSSRRRSAAPSTGRRSSPRRPSPCRSSWAARRRTRPPSPGCASCPRGWRSAASTFRHPELDGALAAALAD